MGDSSIYLEQKPMQDGAQQTTSVTKFDDYFMYGIDQMGGDASSMPQCGPSTTGEDDMCRTMYGEESCCTRVVMTDQGSGEQ